jgi:hypothetical protein
VGKIYITRDGHDVVKIIGKREDSSWPYVGDNGETYKENGVFSYDSFPESDYDLVNSVADHYANLAGKYIYDDMLDAINRLSFTSAIENSDVESNTNPKDLIGVKKPSLAAIPASALVHQAMAHKNGHNKYGFYNWRHKKVQALIYIDAALRHITAYLDGEDYAKDSGVHHLGHAAACCNILLDATETGNLIDDRPPKGKAAEVIARLTEC